MMTMRSILWRIIRIKRMKCRICTFGQKEGANFALFNLMRCKNDMPELLEIPEGEQIDK